ncbi:MAG: lysozyme inhibitor LprI family protein [Edaphobacter sp.]
MKILLSLVASSLTLSAYASLPIDCAKAANPTEKTICSTPSLLQADARMTAYFEIATQLVGMGVRGDLYDSQQAFPAVRDKCGTDKACILAAYKKQTAPLETVIANVKTHGPF